TADGSVLAFLIHTFTRFAAPALCLALLSTTRPTNSSDVPNHVQESVQRVATSARGRPPADSNDAYMRAFIEQFIVRFVNWLSASNDRPSHGATGLRLGTVNGNATRWFVLPRQKRAEHIAVLGRTGSGKSSLLRHFMRQDVEADFGFVVFDLHG